MNSPMCRATATACMCDGCVVCVLRETRREEEEGEGEGERKLRLVHADRQHRKAADVYNHPHAPPPYASLHSRHIIQPCVPLAWSTGS